MTRGLSAIVDDVDYMKLSKQKWYASTKNYVVRSIRRNGKKPMIYMHREIMSPGAKQDVDHKNHNTLDNRRANLRICNRSQNLANQRGRKSGFKGAYYSDRGKDFPWLSSMTHNGKLIYLGHYRTAGEAAMAYDAMARKLFGEFARCNFPEDRYGKKKKS